MPFFPPRNVIGLRGEGGESYMTRRKKSLQRGGRRMFGLGERRQGEADVFFEFPSRARVRCFSFFSFTSSPVGRNAQYIRT